MDMSETPISVIREPAAQAEIAFDPFHVVRLANEALQSSFRPGEAPAQVRGFVGGRGA